MTLFIAGKGIDDVDEEIGKRKIENERRKGKTGIYSLKRKQKIVTFQAQSYSIIHRHLRE